MRLPFSRYTRYATAALLLGAVGLQAAELELKSLGGLGEEATEKRNYGPYVDIAAGATFGQSGNVRSGARNFSFEDIDGAAIFSIEVGKSWKWKRLPIMTSLSFEGTLMSTSVTGRTADAAVASGVGTAADNDLVAYNGDMNSLMFTLNASLSLDLYRYRARLGKVLAGFRPYVGAGIGGGQTWFRNMNNQSRDQFQGNTGANATVDNPASTVFSVDEFINQWHWYAGIEWTWEDRYSAFVEYRDFRFGDLDDLADFDSQGYVVGLRYRY
jgi:hypothetical protein